MTVFTMLQNFISIRQKEPCLRRKYVYFQKMLSDPCLNIAEKCFREKSEVFISEFSVLGIVQNGKLGVETPRKDLTSESMLNAKKENED